MKHWLISLELDAEPQDAARLRRILPRYLREAGFVVTSGTVTVEKWMVDAMARCPEPFVSVNGHRSAEHSYRLPTRRKGSTGDA